MWHHLPGVNLVNQNKPLQSVQYHWKIRPRWLFCFFYYLHTCLSTTCTSYLQREAGPPPVASAGEPWNRALSPVLVSYTCIARLNTSNSTTIAAESWKIIPNGLEVPLSTQSPSRLLCIRARDRVVSTCESGEGSVLVRDVLLSGYSPALRLFDQDQVGFYDTMPRLLCITCRELTRYISDGIPVSHTSSIPRANGLNPCMLVRIFLKIHKERETSGNVQKESSASSSSYSSFGKLQSYRLTINNLFTASFGPSEAPLSTETLCSVIRIHR